MIDQLDNDLAVLAAAEPPAPANFEETFTLNDVVDFGEDEHAEDELAEVVVPDNEIRIFLPGTTKTIHVDGPVVLKDLFSANQIDTVGFTIWVNEVPVTADLMVAPGTIVSMTKVNKGG